MKTASVNEIKTALKAATPAQVLELCLRLARFKKENKELLTYLLFEADDEQAYIDNVKKEIEETLLQVNTRNLYLAKKSVRKILRSTNKYIKYTGSKQVEAELLLYFCIQLKAKIPIQKSAALSNLYYGQSKKARSAIEGLHEDLQYDYQQQLDQLK
jgi:hypothetical protein